MKIAARHRRHSKNRKGSHSLARQRKKRRRRSLISLLPPRVACHRGQRISRALAYFVSPNEGVVVVHGTSRPTKNKNFAVYKQNLPTYSSMQAGPGLNSSCSMNAKHLVLTMSFLGLKCLNSKNIAVPSNEIQETTKKNNC